MDTSSALGLPVEAKSDDDLEWLGRASDAVRRLCAASRLQNLIIHCFLVRRSIAVPGMIAKAHMAKIHACKEPVLSSKLAF